MITCTASSELHPTSYPCTKAFDGLSLCNVTSGEWYPQVNFKVKDLCLSTFSCIEPTKGLIGSLLWGGGVTSGHVHAYKCDSGVIVIK